MPIIYSKAAKVARMQVVQSMIQGGALEICAGSRLLVSVALPSPCGAIIDDTLSCAPEQGAFAVAKGRATNARFVDMTGNPVITGLTVGRERSDVVIDYIDLEPKQAVTITSLELKHA